MSVFSVFLHVIIEIIDYNKSLLFCCLPDNSCCFGIRIFFYTYSAGNVYSVGYISVCVRPIIYNMGNGIDDIAIIIIFNEVYLFISVLRIFNYIS